MARDCTSALIKCFKCGVEGHKANECENPSASVGSVAPGGNKNFGGQTSHGRVFALDRQTAQNNSDTVTGILRVSSICARFLIDSGATHSFLCSSFDTRLEK